MDQIPILRIFGATQLLSADGQPVDDILRRPKRLALLSYLTLAAPGGFHRRDTILGLFWPELDQERARGALRQALYGISKALGEGVLTKRGAGEVGIDTSRLWCDAVEFQRALADGQTEEALSLYKGDALVGLFVPGAGQELEQWMAESRELLRTQAVEAALSLARRVKQSDSAQAARWAIWAANHSHDDEKIVRSSMSLLASVGDRAGALRTYESFAARLRTELESDPSRETTDLADAIRNGRIESTSPVVEEKLELRQVESRPPAAVVVEQRIESVAPRVRTSSLTRFVIPGAVLLVFAAVAVAFGLGSRSKLSQLRNHTVLVGPVITPRGAGIDEIARAIPAMLTEKLSFASDIRVIDRKRALELHAHRRTSPDSVDAARIIARDAGADILLRGSLDSEGRDNYSLRLIAENPATGDVIGESNATGTNPDELVAHAVGNLRVTKKGESPRYNDEAWRLYENGLRSLAAGQSRVASGLLAESFTLDSAHALTAFYLNAALEQVANGPSPEILRKAVQLATTASPVDRLRIRVRWAEVTNDPLLGQLADSLLTIAPDDPDALMSAGNAKMRSGDFLQATPLFRRVVQLDSTSRGGKAVDCLACRALGAMVSAYGYADSAEAAARVMQELVDWKPTDADNWETLSISLARIGHPTEAKLARDRELELRPKDSATVAIVDAITDVNLENYSAADNVLEKLAVTSASSIDDRETALWWLAISLRQQGRFHDAESALKKIRLIDRTPNAAAMLHAGQVYGELGDWQRARIMFDSAARLPGTGADLSSSYGRHRAWTLTHVARARAAIGDTVGLMELADTVRNLGEMSSFGRDWKLHHFIRAEVLEIRGDTLGAISEYRKSIYSPSLGFTVANVRIANLLDAHRKPREAIGFLRSALHGGRDASNTYVTATELHEMMARSFEMSGARDSAAAHYSLVAKGWRNAEGAWRLRSAAAARRAVELGGEQLTASTSHKRAITLSRHGRKR